MVAKAGVDAIGLNFVGGPRQIDAGKAALILDALPQNVEVWALLKVCDAHASEIVRPIVQTGRINCIQMYGLPNASHSMAVEGWPEIRKAAVRHVADERSVAEVSAWLTELKDGNQPDLILLDAGLTSATRDAAAETDKNADPASLGGTGQELNWRMLAKQKKAGVLKDWPPLVLAGGLRPENVAEAVKLVQPAWVDTSSGVESTPGKKDRCLVEAFVLAAKESQA